MKLEGCLLVGYSFSSEDQGTLIVGKQEPGKDVKVINAFANKEAMDILNTLLTKKEADNGQT